MTAAQQFRADAPLLVMVPVLGFLAVLAGVSLGVM